MQEAFILNEQARDLYSKYGFVFDRLIGPILFHYLAGGIEHAAEDLAYLKLLDKKTLTKIKNAVKNAKGVNKYFNPTTTDFAKNMEFVAKNNGSTFDAVKMTAAKATILKILDMAFRLYAPRLANPIADQLVQGVFQIGNHILSEQLETLTNPLILRITQTMPTIDAATARDTLETSISFIDAIRNMKLDDFLYYIDNVEYHGLN